jgi:hypothetical protein
MSPDGPILTTDPSLSPSAHVRNMCATLVAVLGTPADLKHIELRSQVWQIIV